MNFKIDGQDVKLKFGVRFCRELDEVYKVDYEGMEFGMGVNMALMQLTQKSPVALAEVIQASTAHKGFDQDTVDESIDEYAEANGDLNQLFEKIKDELGKSSTVKATINHFKANAKEEETEA